MLNVIITGASGMVGEGVLMESLEDTSVGKVLVVGRKPCGITHPNLTEILHKNFFDLSEISAGLAGYDACFFCLGVPSIGMKEQEYTRLTYDLTMHFAKTVSEKNTGMDFCYVSGSGTDSSEKGKLMWARVKGKTENDLQKLNFKKVYNFRPGMLVPTKGQNNVLKAYNYLGWLAPLVKAISPNSICTIKELGKAMIEIVSNGFNNNTVEVKDIKKLAGRR